MERRTRKDLPRNPPDAAHLVGGLRMILESAWTVMEVILTKKVNQTIMKEGLPFARQLVRAIESNNPNKDGETKRNLAVKGLLHHLVMSSDLNASEISKASLALIIEIAVNEMREEGK